MESPDNLEAGQVAEAFRVPARPALDVREGKRAYVGPRPPQVGPESRGHYAQGPLKSEGSLRYDPFPIASCSIDLRPHTETLFPNRCGRLEPVTNANATRAVPESNEGVATHVDRKP